MAEEKMGFKDQFIALKNIPRLFRLIWAISPKLVVVSLLLRLFSAFQPSALLYVAKLIVDEVVRLLQAPPSVFDDWRPLWQLLAIEIGLVLAGTLLGQVSSFIENYMGDLFSNESSVRIMRHAAELDLYQFEDPQFYDKMERARRQTTGRTILLLQVLNIVEALISIIFLILGLIYFSPWLILIVLLAVIPTLLGEIYFNSRSYSLTLMWTPERRELDYLRYIGASDETAKEIKIFGLADFLVNRFQTISDRYLKDNTRLGLQKLRWLFVFGLLGTAAYYGAYIFILIQTIGGVLSLGTMTFLSGAFRQLSQQLRWLMNLFSRLAESALHLQDYFDFLAIKPLMRTSGGLPVPETIRQGFVFENVSFKYLNSEKYAVKNLSFELKAGEKLALVGENGAGKTTIVKLLARMYEPTEGRILLDGIDLKEYNPVKLRELIGVIFQDFIRFQMVASENIAIGRIDQSTDNARIEEAASKSLAAEVVDTLPLKYGQMLGRRFKDGVDLSGGQWQKIALARAYMRDAQLLILDEPTAALDARAEHDVFLRFAELTKGKSAVLISHRFSTVRMADTILFLENGQKVEMGTHEELMAQKGKYAELFLLQARGYM